MTTSITHFALLVCALASACSSLRAQTPEGKGVPKFTHGPAKAQLGKVAHIDVPSGYIFIDGKGYQALLKAEGEPVSGRELGCLASTNDHWSVVFQYSDIGYVKDDDKDDLQADKLLDSIRRGTAEANKEREAAGHPPIEVVGWELPPNYNPTTHNLEWAIRGAVAGEPILNYNTRLLGRRGVMEVVLIIEPDLLQATLPAFRNLMAAYSFKSGDTYAEYRPGDKVAKLGLGALVVGGAAVGAAKLGLFAWLAVLLKKAWKLVIVAVVAIAAAIKKLFGGSNSRADSGGPPANV